MPPSKNPSRYIFSFFHLQPFIVVIRGLIYKIYWSMFRPTWITMMVFNVSQWNQEDGMCWFLHYIRCNNLVSIWNFDLFACLLACCFRVWLLYILKTCHVWIFVIYDVVVEFETIYAFVTVRVLLLCLHINHVFQLWNLVFKILCVFIFNYCFPVFLFCLWLVIYNIFTKYSHENIKLYMCFYHVHLLLVLHAYIQYD
jgi:hypothetical protein